MGTKNCCESKTLIIETHTAVLLQETAQPEMRGQKTLKVLVLLICCWVKRCPKFSNLKKSEGGLKLQ